MSTTAPHRHSLTDLFGGLASDVTLLFRKEVQLAKIEASEKVDHMVHASQGLIAGIILAIGAAGALLAACVVGIAALLISAGLDTTLSYFVGALIVALVVGGIAAALIAGGLGALKASNLNMDRTGRTLARDVETVKETF
jgi:hypothetical protein